MKIASQTIKKNSVVLALSLCIIGAISGCSTIQSGSNTAKAVWVNPAPDAGFIEQTDRQVNKVDLPFQRVWINQRRAAFEGRLRDLQTGEIVATFADRNMQDVGPIDMTRLTWYGPAKGIMDQWSKQFVQIANRKPGEVITDPVAFTLRPF